MTLKVLPERATDYFASEPLLSLSLDRGGVREPVPYTLAVAVHVARQGSARWALNVKHRLVDALRRAIPIIGGSATVEQEAADDAHKESIEELFRELHEMCSKIVSLSVSLLLEASTLEVLDAQTEAARAAFNAVGNSELETSVVGRHAAERIVSDERRLRAQLRSAEGGEHARRSSPDDEDVDQLSLLATSQDLRASAGRAVRA
jgi:hypothetical protein